MYRFAITTLVAAALHGPVFAQQGVTANEIVIGSILDLSGPVASLTKQARNGMLLRVEEINEQGGIHGRKLSLKVEDSSYDPKKAALAAEKLVNRDKIFAMLGHTGTAHNVAAMPTQFRKNVINFFPLSGAREMYDPPHKLKFAFMPPYPQQMEDAVAKLVREKGSKRVCILYQDDESGLEILRGTEAGLKSVGLELVEKTSFKRGATEFSTQVAKMQASDCELAVLGTIIRETIGTVATARKAGWNPTFLTNFAAYTDLIHKLGGPAMNGIYAPMSLQMPYLDDSSQTLRFWANKYKTKFNEDPGVFSAYGYLIVDTFALAASKAGRNLTTDSFVKAMESTKFPTDIFGSPVMTFSATKRLGNADTRLSQIQDGKWQVVSDYMRAEQEKTKK